MTCDGCGVHTTSCLFCPICGSSMERPFARVLANEALDVVVDEIRERRAAPVEYAQRALQRAGIRLVNEDVISWALNDRRIGAWPTAMQRRFDRLAAPERIYQTGPRRDRPGC